MSDKESSGLAPHVEAEAKWRIVLPGALGVAARFLAACAAASSVPAMAACGADEPAPVVAARAFAAAVQRADTEAVLGLVESSVAERVSGAAQRASDHVGGRRNIEPREMLQIVDVDPKFQVVEAELVRDDGSSATVRLTGADGKTHELALVNEDGQWHVRVPLPPARQS